MRTARRIRCPHQQHPRCDRRCQGNRAAEKEAGQAEEDENGAAAGNKGQMAPPLLPPELCRVLQIILPRDQDTEGQHIVIPSVHRNLAGHRATSFSIDGFPLEQPVAHPAPPPHKRNAELLKQGLPLFLGHTALGQDEEAFPVL